VPKAKAKSNAVCYRLARANNLIFHNVSTYAPESKDKEILRIINRTNIIQSTSDCEHNIHKIIKLLKEYIYIYIYIFIRQMSLDG